MTRPTELLSQAPLRIVYGATDKLSQLINEKGEVVFDAAESDETGQGAKAGTTVTAAEYGDTGMHRTVLTLTDTPITLTDDAGVGQFATLKLYDFPAGNIMVLGAVVDVDITLDDTWWTDTAEGDVGLGTAATADGTALSTTRQNIVPTTAIAALVAQVGPVTGQSTAALVTGAAGGTDADLILNLRIDDSAAHMPNLVTNGSFDTDASWTKGTGWTIDAANSNKAECDGTQTAASLLSQTIATLTAGVSYILTYTTTRSAGTITPSVGGTAGTVRSSANTFTETIVAGSDGVLAFSADADFVGSIDTVTLTPVTGTGSLTGTITVVWTNVGDI